MKPTANLNRNTVLVDDGKDSIVIISDLGGIVGGRALDVSSVPSYTKVIRAGHIIVKNADGGHAPLGVSGGSYVQLPEGARYAGVLKHSVPVSDPRASILTAGQVNAAASPYPVNAEIIAALPMIQFLGAAISPAPTPPVPPTDSPMYFEAVEANSTVAMMSMLETAPNLEYSTDGETWQEWEHTTVEGGHIFDTITLGSVGDRVYLRGVNPEGFSDIENEVISWFSMTGKIAAGGNAQSLVDGAAPTLVAKTMPLFSDMFLAGEPSDVLMRAPALPATTLAELCYADMFGGCTSLTMAPALPATTLADWCYYEMFAGCTSLTTAPALPATTLAEGCYANMFGDCTGLTQAPALPATTLAERCYADMFYGCEFDMSDDGTTFNFQCDATLPQTVGGRTFTTPEELASWMGNTNGFTNP